MAEGGIDLPKSREKAQTEATTAIVNYLRESPKSPLFSALRGFFPQTKSPLEVAKTAPALTQEEIKSFRNRLVDAGVISETTTEIGISDEDISRLATMTPTKDLLQET